MDGRNNSRSVLVTGASTGIGLATVKRLAGLGWNVLGTVRSESDAEALGHIDRCTPLMLEFDLDGRRSVTETTIDAIVPNVDRLVGSAGLAGLVNNAGIVVAGLFETLSVDDWRRQFEVNVFGAVELTRRLLPAMRRAVDPRVVMVGSISGRVGAPMLAPYCASKHALDGVAKSLRREFRSTGPRVTLIEPGAVTTPLWGKANDLADRIEAGLDDDQRRRYGTLIAAQREALADGERQGIEPDAVAELIEKTLTVSRPRARYLIGMDARAGGVLDRVLPDAGMELLGRLLAERGVRSTDQRR
ncbi:MAG: SDR family NAD(P)-dependent oxidoreductase [Actinomycetia bacterium]|nr:SDR family NAD(P)-dependent oxidoreductase [Actinomycetes bacterium]MCP4961374.1 SDR family NAD(P)-dependent oxidoreductase [Actinomycetes bacterium]